MPIDYVDVPAQIYISNTKPKKELFNQIQERQHRDKKPSGGLWTSKKYINENNELTSPWIEWYTKNMNISQKEKNSMRVWELKTNKPSKVLKINTKTDIQEYSVKYTHKIDGEMYKFNWRYIFDELDCDAMWLTQIGLKNLTNVFVDKKYSMISWDVESILWSNWVFDEILKHKKLFNKQIKP